ncbi:hypothetical protein F442_11707 [Phytophthora nicotianae P10297]|uniref:Uncharacterized protein n=1 Tax=Phytophthora nicotianae P10297 TaxID=1317064 RepID=W2Z1V4_PHYNI|nr:hypothetical protein F442_11707 [Phytophthora nicotianae P10297]
MLPKPLAKSLAVLVIVPIPGDCNFEQKYTVAMSMGEKVFTSMEKLQGKPQVKADVDPDDDSCTGRDERYSEGLGACKVQAPAGRVQTADSIITTASSASESLKAKQKALVKNTNVVDELYRLLGT